MGLERSRRLQLVGAEILVFDAGFENGYAARDIEAETAI